MTQALLQWPGFWGFGGGLVYALNVLRDDLRAARLAKTPIGRCFLDLLISLAISIAAAAVFTRPADMLLHITQQGDMQAIAAVIGAVVNSVGPDVLRGLGDLVRKWAPGGGR